MSYKMLFAALISIFLFASPAIVTSAENPYGFQPASATVHNYVVTDGVISVLLADFASHLKPLPQDYENYYLYQADFKSWKEEDGGKWARLWPYVPMFSREDTKGFIELVDEPGQTTTPNPVEVALPHLARTYEVASALSYILSPYKDNRSVTEPNLASQWVNPDPWSSQAFWLDSGENRPGSWDDLGPVCDPQQVTISSSGDLAYDGQANTQVFKTLTIANPHYDPDCEVLVEVLDPITGEIISTYLDDSACYVDQALKYSPTYLKTYTPYLHALMDRLLTGPNAVFALFKPYVEVINEDLENWPAAGRTGEETLAYSYSGGQTEAGLEKDPDTAQYYFKYLGTIHCQKEKLAAKLQPFINGQEYEIDPQCTGEETPTGPGVPGGPGGKLPSGPRWMQWPMKGPFVNQCYRDTRSGSTHSGLDLNGNVDDALIYAAAVGTVASVGFDAPVFGYYVVIKHDNGWNTLYAHMKPSIKVHTGQVVNLGQVLGTEGTTGGRSSGPHLHLGLSRGSNYTDFYVTGPTADPCAAIEGCSCQDTGN